MSDTTETISTAPPTGEGGRDEILLIDDNADYLLLIRRALEGRDPRYRVTPVSSPEEGEALLEQREFDLVLIDYKFPRGGNGLQVIRRLKAKRTYIPTVMVTAFGDEGLAIQAMRDGALDFVPKTSDFLQALPDVVARAIERGRIIRERIATQRALERRNRELQALNDLASAINASTDRDAIFEACRRALGTLCGTRRVASYLRGSEGWLTRVGEGWGEDRLEPANPRTLLLRDAMTSLHAQVSPAEDTVRILAVPLVASDRAIGVAAVALPDDRELASSELDIANSIGKQAGVAIEHARLYRDLASTRHYLQDLVENAADAILTIDPWGRLITWNSGAETAFGYTADQVQAHDWEMLWPEDSRPQNAELARRVLETGEIVRNHETAALTASGRRLEVLLTLSPLSAPDGSVHGVSCIAKNVTLQSELARQLAQSEKMGAVGQLISGVAHEINNPLTAILGYAQLVADVDVGEKLPGYLRKIATEAGRCQRIVAALLDFARKREPQAVRLELNDVIESTLSLSEHDLRVAGIAVDEKLGVNLPSTLGDPHQLQQVFVNLITNARHAMKECAGARLSIATRIDDTGLDGRPCLIVTFDDNGPGIPPDALPRIFNPFFTTKSAGDGTGLGLSVSFGIVQEHGGRIVAGPAPGGGARFEVSLPVLRELAGSLAGRSGMRSSTGSSRKRVLVVDGGHDTRDVVADVVASAGGDLAISTDRRGALDLILRGEPFDVIVMDPASASEGDRLMREVRIQKPELIERTVLVTRRTEDVRSAVSALLSLAPPCRAGTTENS